MLCGNSSPNILDINFKQTDQSNASHTYNITFAYMAS